MIHYTCKTFSALILIALSFICILIPVISLGVMITGKVEYIVVNYENVIDALQIQLQVLVSYLDLDINLNISKPNISGWLSQRLQYFVGSTFTMSMSIFIMDFILYYMLTKISLFKTSLHTFL